MAITSGSVLMNPDEIVHIFGSVTPTNLVLQGVGTGVFVVGDENSLWWNPNLANEWTTGETLGGGILMYGGNVNSPDSTAVSSLTLAGFTGQLYGLCHYSEGPTYCYYVSTDGGDTPVPSSTQADISLATTVVPGDTETPVLQLPTVTGRGDRVLIQGNLSFGFDGNSELVSALVRRDIVSWTLVPGGGNMSVPVPAAPGDFYNMSFSAIDTLGVGETASYVVTLTCASTAMTSTMIYACASATFLMPLPI